MDLTDPDIERDRQEEDIEAAAVAMLERRLAPLVRTAERYENALLWIRHLAALHYLGEAFVPEHMRTLANIAANALAEDDRFQRDLPDFEEARQEALVKAEELSAHFAAVLYDPEDAEPDDTFHGGPS